MSSYDDIVSNYNSKENCAFMRCLLYGKQGSGKTTLASTFPNPLFIDTDSGMRAIRNASIPRVEMGKLKNNPSIGVFKIMMELLTDAKTRSGKFASAGPWGKVETFVIDSMTTLADEFLLPEIMREGKRDPLKDKAVYDDYGRLKIELIQIGALIKDLSETMNVVTTALLEIEKDEITGSLQGKPMMTGKYRDLIGAVYDEVYFMEASDIGAGRTKYVMHASPYMFYEGKTRMLSKTVIENVNYGKIKEAFIE